MIHPQHGSPSLQAATVLLFSLALLLSGTGNAVADQAGCEAIAGEDFSVLPQAATHILNTSWSAPTGNKAGYCEVSGYVAPSVGFGIQLPVNWNGRFIYRGCGGFCGSVWMDSCSDAVERGYACIASDMGHKSTPLDGKWAYNNRQGEIDFAYRATHVTALAGKAITASYYGTAHRFAYYQGCSTGGRQGMVAAQSFPHDFDGIIAGAPVIHETGAGVQLMWSVLANIDASGKPILEADDLPIIHAAALEHCDTKDGQQDGIIDDPLQCDFDPGSLVCGKDNNGRCLTPQQIEVAKKIYQGPVDGDGNSLELGGLMPGSELNWTGYIGTQDSPSLYYSFMTDLFRYMSYAEDPGANWQAQSMVFSQDLSEFGVMERLYSGTNPDLRRFKRHGGKLLVYHGWRDQSVNPFFSLDYHAIATRAMGGKQATDEFFRLFMIPGMNHCEGGPGPWEVDYLSAMEAWVEHGQAPEKLVGRNTQDGSVVMERDVYPRESGARPGSALVRGSVLAGDHAESDDGVRRSDLFVFTTGDQIEDSGQLLVTGGRFDRTEDFEVVRRPTGGRVMSSVITGASDSYTVHARWNFDAAGRANAATGIGNYGAEPVSVDIQVKDDSAALVVTGAVDTHHATACGVDCLIDMSPSALPMFVMTRRYDDAQSGPQTFRWIARSLIVDQVLLEASAVIWKLGDFVFRQGERETLVSQYAFVETMKDEASGKTFKGAFNLYTTADHRPLAFATGGKTVGERVGYTGITQALPPKIPPID